MYADMQPIIDIRESRLKIEYVKNDSPVGADEAIGRSIKFREEACKAYGISQSEQRPTSSDVRGGGEKTITNHFSVMKM